MSQIKSEATGSQEPPDSNIPFENQFGSPLLQADMRDEGDKSTVFSSKTRSLVVELFQIILKRYPDEGALESFGAALESGALDAVDIVRELMQSKEFVGIAAAAHAASAADPEEIRHSITEIFQLILKRDPDDISLDDFTFRVISGNLNLINIVLNLLRSEEFALLQSPPSAAVVRVDQARSVVSEIFQLTLKRNPDEEALSAYSAAVQSGALTPMRMLSELLNSDEFGTSALMATQVARYVVTTIFISLMGRVPEEEAIRYYSGLLEKNGYALPDIFQSLMSSTEFMSRMQRPEKIVLIEHNIPFELGILAESLIAERLRNDHCNIEGPSLDATKWPLSAQNQMRSMLLTLGMFAGKA